MMKKVFVKPAPGGKIRMPDNPAALLPDDGMEVDLNKFWARRLADGSVVQTEEAR